MIPKEQGAHLPNHSLHKWCRCVDIVTYSLWWWLSSCQHHWKRSNLGEKKKSANSHLQFCFSQPSLKVKSHWSPWWVFSFLIKSVWGSHLVFVKSYYVLIHLFKFSGAHQIVLRVYFWQVLGNHMWCPSSNWGWPCERERDWAVPTCVLLPALVALLMGGHWWRCYSALGALLFYALDMTYNTSRFRHYQSPAGHR